ncbi:hypothetical protein [Dokdonia sp. Hel_I_53]|uniref:hypothetical protein n=1 Tax=Dokdonia sp. Hel_I_53 TaxID=1566287 RepID=UPI00119BB9C9|nr:hypothetical protein [Dokdonia sp. Hel_I_53]TVZ51982.1 hypothetical protein OD90_1144 [Dokdonia sp. Hel_I_53]
MKEKINKKDQKEIDLGPQKDEHINQYGVQDDETLKRKINPSEDDANESSTISNKANAVQDHAHKDAEIRSKQ